MINSRNLDDLLPSIALAARGLIAEAETRFDIELRVTSTYRDFEEQARLAEMRPPVTKAGPGMSWHNWRRAFDVVPVRAGVCLWDDASLWTEIGALAPKYGLEWGGDFAHFADRPHFQRTNGLSLHDLIAQHPRGLA